MKNIFTIFCTFLISSVVFGQQKYARITRNIDCAIEGNTAKMVKLFENEIYPILADENTAQLKGVNKKGIILKFGETKVEVPWGSGAKQTYDYPVAIDEAAYANWLKKQYEFIVKQDSVWKIDFSQVSFSQDEIIFVASQEVKDAVKLQSKKTAQISENYFSKHFENRYLRVIPQKMPTLVYSPQDFIQQAPPEDTQGLQNITPEVSTNYGWRNFLILMGVAAVVLLFFFRKKLLPQTRTNEPKKENLRRHNESRPDAPAPSVIFTPTGRSAEKEPEKEVLVEKEQPETTHENQEIQELPKKWQVTFDELRLTNDELLKTTIALEKDLAQANEQIDSLKSEFVVLPKHENFLKNQLPIWNLLLKYELQTQEFYEKSLHQKASLEREYIEKMLFRYYFQKNKLKYLEKWQNILANLQLQGKIIDKDLLNLLATDLSEKELHFILQTDLFEQVYKNWISLLLILFEELQNLDKFTQNKFLMSAEMQEVFAKASQDLRQKSKEFLGKDLNYIALFSDFSEENTPNIRQSPFSQLPLSQLYENIDIKKGQIWAIKSYGFNHTPTEIIIF